MVTIPTVTDRSSPITVLRYHRHREGVPVKIYRYRTEGGSAYAMTSGNGVMPAGSDLFNLVVDRSASPLDLERLDLLIPVRPGKIVAIGRNYRDHVKELGNDEPPEPVIFLKPPSSLLDPEATIVRPPSSQRVDFEGELVIVIGKRARNIKAGQWRDVVLGFTCGNDVTARDLQKKDGQWTRGKSFDTFCPLGPCIETELDISDLQLSTRVNGQARQHESTSKMIFNCPFLVEFITAVMTLDPGDVILTGTPAGIGPLQSGDVVEVEIEGIGTLRNRVS